jgi:hypothetical protein
VLEAGELPLRRRPAGLPTQPGVDRARRALAVTDRAGDGAFRRDHVAAGEDPRVAGLEVGPHPDDAVLDLDPRHAVEEREVGLLPEREHERVRAKLLELAGRLREAVLVELHALQDEHALVGASHSGEPLHQDALLLRLLDLERVRRHALARAPVDDDRILGAEPLGRAGHVEGGVPAAVDGDATAEQRPFLPLHAAQHRDGVEHACCVAGGDLGALADLRPDGEEGRVEAAVPYRLEHVCDGAGRLERDPQVEDALHLGVEDVPWQPVRRDPEAHHSARPRARVADRDLVPQAREVVRGGEPGRPCADDEDTLAGGFHVDLDAPATFDRLVAEEPLHRVDPDRLVELGSVARRLARVVTDAAHDGRERVVLHDLPPRALVPRASLLGVVEPSLHVLPGRAGVAAGREQIDVHRALGAPASRLVGPARADVERDRERLLHPTTSGSSRPKRSMLRSAIA